MPAETLPGKDLDLRPESAERKGVRGLRRGSAPLAAVVAALLVLMICGVIDSFARSAYTVETRALVAKDVEALARYLSDEVARESAAADTLAAFVLVARSQPKRLESDFPLFAETLMEQATHVRSVQLAPGSVLRFVYPLEGNEAAIGLDLMADADRRRLLLPAIETGETVIQGPVELVQGGTGLLVRRPTYEPDGTFWGFSAIVLDWDQVAEHAGLRDLEGMVVGLRSFESGELLDGDPTAFEGDPVTRSLYLGATDTIWELAVRPVDGWRSAAPVTSDLWIGGVSVALFAGLLAFRVARRPQILRRERQAAMDDLALAEARYQAAFEHVDAGIVISGLAGTIIRANPAFRRILGLGDRAPLARTLQDYIHPEHLAVHWRRTLELHTAGEPFVHEIRLVHGDVERWCRIRVAAMPGDFPEESVFVAVTEDITERRAAQLALVESEARFRTLFELAPVAIQREDYRAALARAAQLAEPADLRSHLEANRDDIAEILGLVTITDANPAATELQEHLVQGAGTLTLEDRLSDAAIPTYIDTLVAMAQGEMNRELEVTTVDASGEPMYLVVRWRVPITNGEPDHSAVLVSISDVTELVRVERQLQGLLASKDQFLATVAHELRTPLTAVVGFSQELLTHRAEHSLDDCDEFLDLIAFNSSEMAHLVDDLLVLATADVGEVSVVPVAVELGALIQDSIRVVRGLNAGVDLPESEVVALVDPARVRQIVRNLGTNALRYGGDDVLVSLRMEGSSALIEVSDDGPGLSPSVVQRIFEPYQRAVTEANDPGSIGLGLTVSRGLARLMGGDLVMIRRSGRNVFKVSLPLAEAVVSAIADDRVA